MPHDMLRILTAQDVQELLAERERAIIDVVRMAYEAHAQGLSTLPNSTFLRFPTEPANRIIALPAYLGATFNVAGLKWIASFPGNHAHGLARASAVVVLNSVETGHPTTILEGSLISAKRTAASAALAALQLHQGPTEVAGLIGCGVINFEVARFLLTVFPGRQTLVIYDTNAQQAQAFAAKCQALWPQCEVQLADQVQEVFRRAALVCLATTAIVPHITDLPHCDAQSTILHVSLRDLAPALILQADNVVDDVGHVCRAETSVHLAEQRVQSRSFIRCTLADTLLGSAPPRPDTGQPTIFSPFGLGVLDLAVSTLVLDAAVAQGRGLLIEHFLPSV